MPDWSQIVRNNLRVLRVCSPEFTEELAGHLEDSCEALLCEGVPAEAAIKHTMNQIEGRRKSWLTLRFLQEDLMTGLIRKVALPGVLVIATARFFWWMLLLTHVQPKVILVREGYMFPPRVPVFLILPFWWWGLLPVCGALGALLSQCLGGSRLQRTAVSVAPVAIMGASMLLAVPTEFYLDGFPYYYQWWHGYGHLECQGFILLSFVVVPALLLLLGASIAEVSTRKFDRLAQ